MRERTAARSLLFTASMSRRSSAEAAKVVADTNTKISQASARHNSPPNLGGELPHSIAMATPSEDRAFRCCRRSSRPEYPTCPAASVVDWTTAALWDTGHGGRL